MGYEILLVLEQPGGTALLGRFFKNYQAAGRVADHKRARIVTSYWVPAHSKRLVMDALSGLASLIPRE